MLWGRIARDSLSALLAKMPMCILEMEACCGAYLVGRTCVKAQRNGNLGGDRLGVDTADSALCVTQGRGAAPHAGPASGARMTGAQVDSAGQPNAGVAAQAGASCCRNVGAHC